MKTLITLLMLGMTSSLMAQSISCDQGDQVEAWEAIGQNVIEVPLYITNDTGSPVNINVARSVQTNIAGAINYFCWGINCYDPQTSESPVAQTIEAGATDQTFKAYLETTDEGVFSARYTFQNAQDIFDEIEVIITINVTPTGVSELTIEQRSISLYPNPARDFVNMDFTNLDNLVNPTVVVYDLVGNKVLEERIDNYFKQATIEVGRFEDGYYLMSIVDQGQILDTQRLVISH